MYFQEGDREEDQLKDLTPNSFLDTWLVGKRNAKSLLLQKVPGPSQVTE